MADSRTQNTGDGDAIHIEQLELSARIGVPNEERAAMQRLTVSITLWPQNSFGSLGDELTKTVDYAAVCRNVKGFVANRGDKLIETLAAEMASHLLASFAIDQVRIELRKFILRDVKYVAVILTRTPRQTD